MLGREVIHEEAPLTAREALAIEGQDGGLESRLHQLCRDLLSNPVIEDYELLNGTSGKNKENKGKNQTKRRIA